MVTAMKRRQGFTLIELLVVLAIIATLMTIAMPRYFNSLESSREATLRQSLAVLREALDHYYGDTGHYPDSLEQLVEQRYLRNTPVDPITERSDAAAGTTARRRGRWRSRYQERCHREGAGWQPVRGMVRPTVASPIWACCC